MRIDVLTLFPELVAEVGAWGVTGRAVERGLLALHTWNPRAYADNRHGSVDDRPFGGGPGMVMQGQPLEAALASARRARDDPAPVIALGPAGERFDQAMAERLAAGPGAILVAGRYEGIDERFVRAHVDFELSIGDYVLSGGELAAMVVVDAVSRLLPGALGHEDSAAEDSFSAGLLDHPHYTRPRDDGRGDVPEVLFSGDHAAIERWRLKQALGRTWLRRPGLLDGVPLSDEARALLREFIAEQGTSQ